MLKFCNHCNQELPIEDFPKKSSAKDGHASRCKKYYKERNDANYEKNRDIILERQNNYNKDNYEKVRESNRKAVKKYRENNLEKEKIRDKKYKSEHKPEIAERTKKRRHTDIQFKIGTALRNRLNHALKGNFKRSKTLKLLDCTVEFFKGYIEAQFQPGMTWDNWTIDGWHLDHKKALNNFDLTNEEELKQAMHYTNFQPLWAIDNIKKGDKE